jgi:hypothetical protein
MLALNNRGGQIIVPDDKKEEATEEEKEIYRPSTPDYEPAALEEKETEITSDVQIAALDEFGRDLQEEEELPVFKRARPVAL